MSPSRSLHRTLFFFTLFTVSPNPSINFPSLPVPFILFPLSSCPLPGSLQPLPILFDPSHSLPEPSTPQGRHTGATVASSSSSVSFSAKRPADSGKFTRLKSSVFPGIRLLHPTHPFAPTPAPPTPPLPLYYSSFPFSSCCITPFPSPIPLPTLFYVTLPVTSSSIPPLIPLSPLYLLLPLFFLCYSFFSFSLILLLLLVLFLFSSSFS